MELNYILCGDYYIPELKLSEEKRPIGKWGRMHRDYLKEHHPIQFNLLAIMTDEQKDLFSRYQDCVREFQTMAECLLFQNRFRLGARMMLEIMEDDPVNHSYR